ncbi:MAG: hypothetical protein WC223_13095 [Bacteroidales bacterium]|jgi:hypothetical protein
MEKETTIITLEHTDKFCFDGCPGRRKFEGKSFIELCPCNCHRKISFNTGTENVDFSKTY